MNPINQLPWHIVVNGNGRGGIIRDAIGGIVGVFPEFINAEYLLDNKILLIENREREYQEALKDLKDQEEEIQNLKEEIKKIELDLVQERECKE